MSKEKTFYITTPIYYVNAKPHLGHAYTTIVADVMARFQKELDQEAFFLTGTDEHGLKIQKKAQEAGKNPQEFVDEVASQFKELWKELEINYSKFIRTTDKDHKEAIKNTLEVLLKKGAIYKGQYEGLYCVGCEQFKNESDLVDGKCPDHDIEPEKIKEECYLLKMAEKQDELAKKIEKDELKIMPLQYKNEILSFLKTQKLKDLSISRKNVSWGIPLPFDEKHTTYVWVDALLNYLTGLGWKGNPDSIPKQWPVDIQLIGKDILRVHATIWPILLMHLGIELPKAIFVHGHILSGGKKMSKTLGNTIGIEELVDKFGREATRYLLLSAGTFGNDVDITMERLTEKYNADLANGLGNLVSRVVKLSEKADVCQNPLNPPSKKGETEKVDWVKYEEAFNEGKIEQVLGEAWEIIKKADKFVEESKPWELAKTDKDKFNEVMARLLGEVALIAKLLAPFMPETSEKIKEILKTGKLEILFPRV